MALWIYYIESKAKLFGSDDYKKYVSVACCLIGLTYLFSAEYFLKEWDIMEYKSPKGYMITEKAFGIPLQETVEWINNNTKPTDIVLVLPEGVMVNHLTGRMTNPKYYQLPPNHIAAFGEDKIVADLDKNKPDYILINNWNCWTYNAPFMCVDFGFKICDFTFKNYEKVFETEYEFFKQEIYRLKKSEQ